VPFVNLAQFASFRSEHQKRIDRFMTLAGQNLPLLPTIPSLEIRKLRASLILEEALETIEALGIAIELKVNSKSTYLQHGDVEFAESKPFNMIQVADGCADVSVVNIGTLSACGIPDLPLLKLIDENNLAKFGPGGHRREDGKWIKPLNHQPPDVEKLLVDIREWLQLENP
jgi:predicted HAD superfamily Cof-like phosphohydrolase